MVIISSEVNSLNYYYIIILYKISNFLIILIVIKKIFCYNKPFSLNIPILFSSIAFSKVIKYFLTEPNLEFDEPFMLVEYPSVKNDTFT